MTATSPRIAPVPPPYPPELQAVFDRIMPPGVPPLALLALRSLTAGVRRRQCAP
jgi:hypothetical protein